MPIKNDHGLYGTIMSAMPMGVKNEIDLCCEKHGYLKSVLVLKLFGGYDSRNIIMQWFTAKWERYRLGGGSGIDSDLKELSRTHYDKVVKILPPAIKRDVFIYAAAHGVKKIQLIETVFGAYDFGKIVHAWFRAVWAKSK